MRCANTRKQATSYAIQQTLLDVLPLLSEHIEAKDLYNVSISFRQVQAICTHHQLWHILWQDNRLHPFQASEHAPASKPTARTSCLPPPFGIHKHHHWLNEPYRNVYLWLQLHHKRATQVKPWPKALAQQAPQWMRWLAKHHPDQLQQLDVIYQQNKLQRHQQHKKFLYRSVLFLSLTGAFIALISGLRLAKYQHDAAYPHRMLQQKYWPIDPDMAPFHLQAVCQPADPGEAGSSVNPCYYHIVHLELYNALLISLFAATSYLFHFLLVRN